MFATAIRSMAKKPKPKMKPIELKTPPERTQSITRAIFDVVKEHGPITIAETWNHIKMASMGDLQQQVGTFSSWIQDAGLIGLTSKRHMKIMLRWMREKQKLRLICNHVGAQKQFLYTTWFTSPKAMPPPPGWSGSFSSRRR